MQINANEFIEKLEGLNERELIGMAYCNHAAMLSSQVTPEDYGKICIAFFHKLGFPVLPLENLDEAAAKYLPATEGQATEATAGEAVASGKK